MKAKDLARAGYEVMRAVTSLHGRTSMSTWDNASYDVEINIMCQIHYICTTEYPNAGDVHRFWMEHQSKRMWSFGAVYNQDIKHDPLMVHWEDLPKNEKAKYECFLALILRYRDEVNQKELADYVS